MKKILDIINIAEAKECHELETDYKIERKNLKRYQESLKLFKTRISENVFNLACIEKNLFNMHQNQSKSRKKTSEVEYYMYNGVKVFGNMLSVFHNSSQFYNNLREKINTLEVKICKSLADHKKKHEKNSEQHEKEIKLYASECYPQTNSILFIIGFMSANKVQKKGDSFRQNTIIEESKRYASFLNQCLSQMEVLKQQTMEISRAFYEGGKDMWIQQIEQFKDSIEGFEVDEQEINKIAEQTGRLQTDRSTKSTEDISPENEGGQVDGQGNQEEPEEAHEQTEEMAANE